MSVKEPPFDWTSSKYNSVFLRSLERARNLIDFSDDEWQTVNNYIFLVGKRIELLEKYTRLKQSGDSGSERAQKSLSEITERILFTDQDLSKYEQNGSVQKLLSGANQFLPLEKRQATIINCAQTTNESKGRDYLKLAPLIVRKAVEAGMESNTSGYHIANNGTEQSKADIIREKAKTLIPGYRKQLFWRIGFIVIAVLIGWFDSLLVPSSLYPGNTILLPFCITLFIVAIVIGIIGVVLINKAVIYKKGLLPIRPDSKKKRTVLPVLFLVLLSLSYLVIVFVASEYGLGYLSLAILPLLLQFLTISRIENIIVNNAAIDFYRILDGNTETADQAGKAVGAKANGGAKNTNRENTGETVAILLDAQAAATAETVKASEETQSDGKPDDNREHVPEKGVLPNTIQESSNSPFKRSAALPKRHFWLNVFPVIVVIALTLIPIYYTVVALNAKSPYDKREIYYFLSIASILLSGGLYSLTATRNKKKIIIGLSCSLSFLLAAILLIVFGAWWSTEYYTYRGTSFASEVRAALLGAIWSSVIIGVLELCWTILIRRILELIKRIPTLKDKYHSSIGYKTKCYNKLAKMADLKEKGIISEEEYESIKKQITAKIVTIHPSSNKT